MKVRPPASTFHPRGILVRGVNWLGDAVMTTPALRRLRERFPESYIAILTPEKLEELWLNHPAVNEVISFVPREGVFAVARKLRQVGSSRRDDRTAQRAIPTTFDIALVFPNSPRSAIETWLAGIASRVGYARPWRNFFLTHAIQPRPGTVRMRKRSVAEIRALVAADVNRRLASDGRDVARAAANSHQIHEYLHLVGELGANTAPSAPELSVLQDELEVARKKFGLDTITVPVFGMNAGAEYGPAKRWPLERFTAAAREIQERTHCVWLIFGGQNDVALANAVQSAIGNRQSAINLAGRTSLRELMALLKMCRVLLTNDSGPMHVAAALGTPVVAPFGSTSPELTAPGLPGDTRHHLLISGAPCSPCFRRECPIDFRCMNSISVQRVADAVLETTLVPPRPE